MFDQRGFVAGPLAIIILALLVIGAFITIRALRSPTGLLSQANLGNILTVTGKVVTTSGTVTNSQRVYQLTNTPTGAVYRLMVSNNTINLAQYVGKQVTVTGRVTSTSITSTILLVQSISLISSGTPGGGTPPSSIALGVYQPATDPFSHGAAVDQYTAQVGKKPALAWFSVKWQNAQTGAYQQFDSRLLDQFRTRGIMPGLNWDASRGPATNKNQPDFSWKAIISGKHDAYITRVARDAASYHYPFLVRLFAEMNGNWYPWGYSVNGNTNPADFVTAWKHVVDLFRNEGATNVQFVYCQSALEAGLINSNLAKLKQIYPGDNYVNWIALDGYANSRNDWRSLNDEFQPSYDMLTSLSTRPMIFYEVGAAENPNDPMFKANWITQGFLSIIPQEFPKVVAVNWFNSHDDRNIDAYNVDTSQNSLTAWKQVVASPLYQGSLLK